MRVHKTVFLQTLVVTKYNMAADICNEALKHVSDKCVAGSKCGDLCDVGDQLILERTSKVSFGCVPLYTQVRRDCRSSRRTRRMR